jgi:hypothetical protein
LAVITITLVTYIIWNYVILEVVGIALGLPWQWDVCIGLDTIC